MKLGSLSSLRDKIAPYFDDLVFQIAKSLWLPGEHNLHYLDRNFSHKLLKPFGNTWVAKVLYIWDKNGFPIHPIPPFGFVKDQDVLPTVRRARKIRFYPNKEQRAILRQWFGCARYTYNRSIEYLQKPGTKANWKGIKKEIMANLPAWSEQTPYQIKTISVQDACQAVKNAKKKYRQTAKLQKVKFKSRKNIKQCIYIPKSAVTEDSFYVKSLGKILFSEKIGETNYDCRVVLQDGRYFLIKPEGKPVLFPENQRNGIVALDCGVRSFQTYYALTMCGKIGEHDFARIYRLCYHMDKLISKIAKAKCRRKQRLKKALTRLRWQIKDLISEIHHKTAHFLCSVFDCIVIPPFETQQMVCKLKSKTARAMLTWAHYRFKNILKAKAQRMSVIVIDQAEDYTSKTCSNCGWIDQKLGSKTLFTCKSCKIKIDRDFNGARGIFLRSLKEHPEIRIYLPNCYLLLAPFFKSSGETSSVGRYPLR